MYQKFFTEDNNNHKFLRCPDLRDNNFEFLSLAITLDKINLECAENVKAKPTGKDSGFITYSNTTHFLVNGHITVAI